MKSHGWIKTHSDWQQEDQHSPVDALGGFEEIIPCHWDKKMHFLVFFLFLVLLFEREEASIWSWQGMLEC